jgi:hypothetical protein
VTLLWKTRLVRLFVAALLLMVVPGVSRVVCISPSGHEAIEDWASLCCLPRAGAPETAFSKPTPCQSCTDYPVAPTIGIKSAQPESSQLVTFDNSALPAMVPFRQDQTTAITSALSLERRFDPVNSPLLTTSLRC